MRRLVALGAVVSLGLVALTGSAHGAGNGPLCRAGDLAGAIIDVQGAAGSQFGRLILVNKSTHTCHTKGFIGGQFVGTDNQNITTHVTRDHSTTAKTVVVKSGAAAALELRWSLVPSGSTPCKKARWLRVTPPDDTDNLRVYFNSTPCRGDLEVRAVTDPRSVT
jgi:hypothetical protein